jgi:RES domain-containing protein
MSKAWRIVKTRYAAAAFDGEGARRFGGRWSSKGVRVVYTAESVALAVLEVLVHLDNSDVLTSYSLCSAEFDDSLVERLDRSALPANWRDYPAPAELQRIGDEWVASGTSAVLEVPSVIVETESNYLLNPAHPDFTSLKLGTPGPFEFDPRLLE